ncbi:MAG TPA: OmpA family protein [Chitinophagaceae bacterium]|jgi:OmpA-OmpF porin, OOP family|nr:OmpA family protein [Chitinophagaceae bacterium]
MKSKFIIVALMTMLPFFAGAQLKGLMNKVKNKVDQRIDNKVDKQIDKSLDEAQGKNDKDVVSNGNASTTAVTEPKAEEPALKSFSKYDFVPGDSILYYENYDKETIAELPVGWNTTGSGEVVTLDKVEGKWLRLHKQFIYLTSNTKEFGENYTVEFDFILQLKNNGWMFPEFNFGLFSTNKEPNTNNSFLKDNRKYAAVFASVHAGMFESSSVKINSYLDNKEYFAGDLKSYGKLEESFTGIPVHVAIQVQKERFRMWINEEKLFDVPKATPPGYLMNQLKFDVGFTNYSEEQYGVFISNIKVATGKPDARHKLVEEGKFSTTGILFDVNSDKIKPTSYGVVKEIADVLRQNSGIKVKIIGHTDSDGGDASNLELSKKRSEAVKDMLVNEFAIDPSRVETDGKGETQAVADNKTKEGKAANRRVEFVKL